MSITTALGSVRDSRLWSPPSRPHPESPTPPNGASGSRMKKRLTHTVPVWSAALTRWARLGHGNLEVGVGERQAGALPPSSRLTGTTLGAPRAWSRIERQRVAVPVVGFGMANVGPAPLIPPQLAALFADGGLGRTLSVALPAGHLVGTAAHPGRRTRVRPAFWLSDKPATATLWTGLRAEHERSGLWPLLLEGFWGNFDVDDDDQLAFPWGGEASAEPVSEIDGHDAAGFLAASWAAMAEANDEMFQEYPEFLLPFGRDWPGLAAPGELTSDPGAVADRCAEQAPEPDGELRLGLVPVRRGADALVATGWIGAVNYFQPVAPLAAVVRSWEDRFGARVVGLGGATALLSVAAPPVTVAHALQVAAEHLMCCSDNVTGVGTLAEYAEGICGETTWSFWWD